MKFFSTIIFLLFVSSAFSQDSLIVSESAKAMSKGTQNGFTVMIPKVKVKDVISDWKKYIREKNKSSYNEINNEYVLSSSVLPDISGDSIIVYTVFESLPTGVELTAFVSSKDSTFISSSANAETGRKINTYLRNFAVNEYRKTVEDDLKAEQKTLKNLEDDLSDLESDNERMEKKIKSNERDNERLKDDIKVNLSAQELKTTTIVQQQQILATFTEESDRKKEEEKRLKNLEKEKKKLHNENEDMNKKIDDNLSENKSLQSKINLNISDAIPAKKAAIESQKKVVNDVETKLKNVH